MTSHNNPKPVISVLVPILNDAGVATSMVGVRRAKNPGAGGLALPGGYLESNETPEEGGAREVFEETGIKVTGLTLVSTSVNHEFNTLTLYYRSAPITIAEFAPYKDNKNAEVSEVVELDHKSELCFRAHSAVLKRSLTIPEGVRLSIDDMFEWARVALLEHGVYQNGGHSGVLVCEGWSSEDAHSTIKVIRQFVHDHFGGFIKVQRAGQRRCLGLERDFIEFSVNRRYVRLWPDGMFSLDIDADTDRYTADDLLAIMHLRGLV